MVIDFLRLINHSGVILKNMCIYIYIYISIDFSFYLFIFKLRSNLKTINQFNLYTYACIVNRAFHILGLED